jgi:hypothetical protein
MKKMSTANTDPHSKIKEEQKIAVIKSIVKESLEELERVENKINELQQKKSSLKRDLMDLKEGRLDRIEERHNVDIESRTHSVFFIEKKVEVGVDYESKWYIPYIVNILDYCGDSPSKSEKVVINNSLAKINASGVYKLKDGKIKNL